MIFPFLVNFWYCPRLFSLNRDDMKQPSSSFMSGLISRLLLYKTCQKDDENWDGGFSAKKVMKIEMVAFQPKRGRKLNWILSTNSYIFRKGTTNQEITTKNFFFQKVATPVCAMAEVEERERFECKECSVSFAFQITLAKHNYHVHKKDTILAVDIKCLQCESKFSTKKSLKIHSMKVHGVYKALIKSQEGGTCEACGKQFNKFLADHIRQNHTIPKKSCDKCDFKTTMTGNLKKHMKIHEDISEPCPHCGQIYKQIEAHLTRTNCGRKPEERLPTSTCPQCGKVLKTEAKMRVHVKRIHNQVRDKQCHFCDYNTYSGGNLRLHIRTQHEKCWDVEKISKNNLFCVSRLSSQKQHTTNDLLFYWPRTLF